MVIPLLYLRNWGIPRSNNSPAITPPGNDVARVLVNTLISTLTIMVHTTKLNCVDFFYSIDRGCPSTSSQLRDLFIHSKAIE